MRHPYPAPGWKGPYGAQATWLGAPQPPYRRGQRGRSVGTGVIPLPPEASVEISERAAMKVRQRAPRGERNSRLQVTATHRRGQVGVHFPPSAVHLLYLDRGVRPFVMWSLEGKTVPIRTFGGEIILRKATGVGQVVPTRDEKGRLTGSRVKWRHPGIEPMLFVEPAIRESFEEWSARQRPEDILRLLARQPGVGSFFQRLRRKLG